MISDVYKRLINGLRRGRGMKPVFDAPAAATPEPDIVDADEGNDGLELGDPDETLELMKRTIRDINDDVADADAGDEGEPDGLAKALGANAVVVRKLLAHHANLAEQPVDPAHAKAVDAAAALIRAAGRRHFR
jgi:hypothetical protein